MKINRSALLLAGLLATLLVVVVHCGPTNDVKKVTESEAETVVPQALMASQALATQVEQVHERFVATRNQQQQGHLQSYPLDEVTGLISDTRKDLEHAIRNVLPTGAEPLLAWVDDEFQQIQRGIPPPNRDVPLSAPVDTPVSSDIPPPISSDVPPPVSSDIPPRGPSDPRLPAPADAPAPAPTARRAAAETEPLLREGQQPSKQWTIPVTTANWLLDRVEEVVRRIFVLASTDDLWVDLWVGSMPSDKALFRFWPQGSANKSLSITTNGKKSQVLRGLYAYSAIAPSGKKSIDSPTTSPAATGWTSDRLDLVKDSRFFCCDFKRGYCHHVDDKKDCH